MRQQPEHTEQITLSVTDELALASAASDWKAANDAYERALTPRGQESALRETDRCRARWKTTANRIIEASDDPSVADATIRSWLAAWNGMPSRWNDYDRSHQPQ